MGAIRFSTSLEICPPVWHVHSHFVIITSCILLLFCTKVYMPRTRSEAGFNFIDAHSTRQMMTPRIPFSFNTCIRTRARISVCYTYRCHFPMSHRQERSRRGQHSKRATMFFSYIPETQHKPKFSSLSMDRGGRHVRTSQMYNYNMLRSGIMFL